MATNELQSINIDDPKVIGAIRATVAQGLTDPEFTLFAEICKATRLNPFKKELWAIKTKGYARRDGTQVEGRLQILTGINGFHAIANGHPEYDGIETGLIDPSGDYKTLAYPKSDFIGAWCKVYRKDRRMPVESVAMLQEYDKSLSDERYPAGGIWRAMKRVMIQKCAESISLRKAFPQELNGIYTSEEMPEEFRAPDVEVTPVEPKASEATKFEPADDAPCYAYDLNKIEDDKTRATADKWIRSQREVMPDSERPGVWFSAAPLKRLAAYQIEA